MDIKKIRKNILRFLAWAGLIFCSSLIKIIPQGWLYNFARIIGILAYTIARKQRSIALESLNIAFAKEKSDQDIRQIAKNCFIYMAKSGMEVIYLFNKQGILKKRIEIEGEEYLKSALSRGKGVILVSAHFGNFPLLLAKLALEGYEVSGIMRPMRDLRVEKFFIKKREEFKIKTIYSSPRRSCVESTIRTLRKNELIFIPLDQNFGTGGIFIDFFGKKAATATGPVVLARRTGAALLPCFIIRKENDTHKIIFEPALDMQEGKTSQETVTINIQKLVKIIEFYIRRYPAEWGWIHRRWKSEPK